MKKQVKRFSQFINESEYEYKGRFGSDLGKKRMGLAVWEIGEGMGGTWSMVSYGGESIQIEEDDTDYHEDGGFEGYDKIFAAAAELGADPDMVYDMENDSVIHNHQIRRRR